MNNHHHHHNSRYSSLGEEDNDYQLSSLHNQVSALKSITIDIGNEVQEQNKLLDGITMDFDGAATLLNRTIRQVKDMTKSEKGRSYLFYSVLFISVIFIFFFLRVLF